MKMVQLRRFFGVQGGTTPSTKVNSYWNGSIPWVTPADMSADEVTTISDTRSKITDEGLLSSNLLLSEPGWIILSNRAPVGKVGICGVPLTCNQGCKLIYPLFKNIYINKFIAYWLNANKQKLELLSSGTTFREISNSSLLSFSIPITDLKHQGIAVNFIESKALIINAIIKNLHLKLNKLSEYRQSLITRAVTKGLDPNVELKDSGVEWIGKIPKHWQVCKVKHIGNSFNGLTYSPKDLLSEGIPVLRSCNVQNAKLDLSDTVFVSKDQARDAMLETGDILICSRNGSAKLIGKCAYISQNQKYAFGAFMMVYRSTLKKFGYYILNSALFRYYKPLFSTTTINQLTSGTFGEFLIPLPPEKERLEISDALDRDLKKIDSLSAQVNQTILKLKEYRSSLISAAVTGQLAINEEATE